MEGRNIIFQPNPGPQTDFLAASEQEVLYGGSAGGGKMVCRGDWLMTHAGPVRIEDVRVGTRLVHPSGGQQKIIQLHPWRTLPMCEVLFSDGTSLEVPEDHLWFAWKGSKGRKINGQRVFGPASGSVVETKTLREWIKRGYKPQIPVTEPVDFDSRHVSVEPYLMGVLLGDGCITNDFPIITCDEKDKEHYKEELPDLNYSYKGKTIAITGQKRKVLIETLKDLGLYGTRSNNKFIPEEFKYNDTDVRWAIAQGLMDTDGYSAPDKNAVYYYTVSKQLSEDAAELFRSLGAVVTITSKTGTYRDREQKIVKCQQVYSLYIKHPEPDKFFRMKRKQHGKFGRPLRQKSIVSVSYPHKKREGRCITVSNPDGLYLTNNYTVTHNSYAMVVDPIRYANEQASNMLLLRRTTEELRELVSISKQLYPQVIPGARFGEREKTWFFPSGATLWMSYLDRDDDVSRYQGQAYNWIGFDELTQWPSHFAWNYMRSRLRSAKKELPLYMRACVDEGEVLTETGWKNIQDVKEGEFVYSVSSQGKLEKKRVHSAVEYEVNESLVRVKKKNLYMSITPDHRVVYQKYGKTSFDIDRWNEIDTKSVSVLRTSTDYNSEGYLCPIGSWSDLDYAKFLGLYVAEGCATTRNRVVITQLKEENHTFINSLLSSGGYSYKYYPNGDFVIHNKELNEFLAPLGKAHQKYFPREFLDRASKEQLKAAFEAYALGDGHWQSKTSCTLVTSSQQLCDDLQEIAVKLGYKTQYKKTTHENPNWNDRYTVYFCSKGKTTKVDKNPEGRNDTTEEFYKGKVYCLGVEENENFILRQNNFVWVSGNTTNPGGVGHYWVKKMFIDPAPAGKAFDATDEHGEVIKWPKGHSREGQPLFKRRFIPASLFDNPYLANDGMYEANLLSLPEQERRRLLEGDWTINEGAAFTEFSTRDHVIDPFEIPDNWPRFRACDYGYGSHTGVLWFAVHPSGQLIVYREMYVSKVTASELADMILDVEKGEKIRYGVLDSSLWHQRGDTGPSLAEQMIIKGCRWRPSDRSRGSRVAGKNEIHRRLMIDEFTGEPGLVFFNTCRNLISQLPSLPLDKNNPEDVDTKAEDHLYDALRYGCSTRPSTRLFDYDPSNQRTGFQAADGVFGY